LVSQMFADWNSSGQVSAHLTHNTFGDCFRQDTSSSKSREYLSDVLGFNLQQQSVARPVGGEFLNAQIFGVTTQLVGHHLELAIPDVPRQVGNESSGGTRFNFAPFHKVHRFQFFGRPDADSELSTAGRIKPRSL